MEFILPFQISKSENKIGFNNKLLFIGSCFAEEIGALMNTHRMDVKLNPHGILFNSLSISSAISDIINQRKYQAHDLVTPMQLNVSKILIRKYIMPMHF